MALDRAQLAALSLSLLIHAAALAALYRSHEPFVPTPRPDAVMQVNLITLDPAPAPVMPPPPEPVRSAVRRPAPRPEAKKADTPDTAVIEFPPPSNRSPSGELSAAPIPAAPADSAAIVATAEPAVPVPKQSGELVIEQPRFRRTPQPPVYPRLSRLRGESGTVLLRARVEADGSISEIRIAASSGFALLDRAALAAVRGWEIEPWRQGARALAAWVELPVIFRLESHETLARH